MGAKPVFDIEVSKVPGLENRIRELRDLRGLTQEALAERMGVAHSTVQRLETGQMNLTTDYMVSLSEALDVHPAELITNAHRIARSASEVEAIEMLRRMPKEAAESWLRTGKHLAD